MNTVQQSTINPAFAGHVSDKLRELSGDLHGVFDNLREIARGDDPKANGYDRLRALKILYDRGCGKVTRNQAQTLAPKSERPPKSEKSQNHTNHSSDNKRQVVRLEQKLDDALGPPQTPAAPSPELVEACPERSGTESKGPHGLPAPSPDTPNYTPDLVRDSQYYVLEITNYGDELATLLWDIHQADPDDDSIRSCHRIAAGLMIIDRVIGPVPDYEQPIDHWHDPSLEPNWAYKHPAEIDSSVPIEEMIEADRDAREFLEDYRQQADSPCEDCTDEYLCEFHDPESELYEDPNDEDGLIMTARGMRNLKIFGDRLYFDEHGSLRLHPPPPIDDS